ncbi:cation diffusion facilitator family transporter [Propionispora hippei]|uniref:Cation diffusion facilitator family transporter n=1 Tax=Propionispora hippei DSM 15287 TaxID=1123003 RepID=A0A1M6KLL9_9FIRM|nr:cation diffusion facilitator family transporter [Propionispora hippei]SHJ59873.1 cation diffusion facilitator family transporter [Propionispora hippei DSM 15287]
MQESHPEGNLKSRTALLSILSNSLLVVLKLAVGLITGTVSIVSEAAHSAVDLIASLVAYVAVRKSDQPPDKNHAYGHGKFENLSGAVEALLIIGAALWIVYEAVDKFYSHNKPEHLEYGILLMVISIALNYWVSGRLLTVARQTESQALEADALHLRADIWTSVGVLIGLVLIKATGLSWLDPLIALSVAGIVFKAGYDMTKKSVHELTDIALPAEEEAIISEIVNRHEEVISFHRLRTRRSGSYRLIDMHLILYKEMHLDKAHAVCDQLEREIEERLGLCDVVIHIEPCDYHDGFGSCPLPPADEEKGH